MEPWIAAWQWFVLGLGRVAALVMLAPVIGGPLVPVRIKILVILLLAAVSLGWPGPSASPQTLAPIGFACLLVKEVLVGFALGMTIVLVLAACQAAGEVLGFQMMFSLGTTFLPATQEQSTLTGNFFYILAILVFVTLDGHHALIRGLVQSFRVLPVDAWPASLGPLAAWVALTGRLFQVGLQLALPVMITLFITNLMLGMIAKTMPQLNIFIVGLPIQITVAFALLIIFVPSLVPAERLQFQEWGRTLQGLVRALAR